MTTNETGQTSKNAPAGEAGRRRRAYREAVVAPYEDGWTVALDGAPAASPSGAPLRAPTRRLVDAIAAEWAAQGAFLDPQTMPLTRLANTAVDGVAREVEAVRADLVRYAGSDLLCYRADAPDSLVAAQNSAWNPVLDWAREAFGARFRLAEGVVFVAQPEEALAAIERAVADVSAPFALAAIHVMTTLTGSVLLALAVARGRLRAEEAWVAAHVDEDEQMSVWGADAEAAQRRARRWTEMETAARMITLLGAD